MAPYMASILGTFFLLVFWLLDSATAGASTVTNRQGTREGEKEGRREGEKEGGGRRERRREEWMKGKRERWLERREG